MPLRRRWFQFSLRWLLLFGGLLCTLLASASALVKTAKAQKQAVAMIESRGGVVGYDFEFEISGESIDQPASLWPHWILKTIGPDYFHRVVYAGLDDTATTDADLFFIRDLPHLQVLVLGLTNVSDKGLECVGGLSELHELYLLGDNVSGEGIKHLARVPHLRVLDLRETQVKEDDLERLADFKSLRLLKIGAAGFSDESIMKLQTALPKCQIIR